jgi:hypothetical protein
VVIVREACGSRLGMGDGSALRGCGCSAQKMVCSALSHIKRGDNAPQTIFCEEQPPLRKAVPYVRRPKKSDQKRQKQQ